MPKLVINRTVTETATYIISDAEAARLQGDDKAAAVYDILNETLHEEEGCQIDEEAVNWMEVEDE